MTLLSAQSWRTTPVSAAMISTVLDHADLHRDLGGGRSLLRLSRARAAQVDVILRLGRDAERAAEIGLVWNDREDQIVRVIDDAALRDAGPAPWEHAFDLFEGDDHREEPRRMCA